MVQLYRVKNETLIGSTKLYLLFSDNKTCRICGKPLDDIASRINGLGFCKNCSEIRYFNTTEASQSFTRIIGIVNTTINKQPIQKLLCVAWDRYTGAYSLYLTHSISNFKDYGFKKFEVTIESVSKPKSKEDDFSYKAVHNSLDQDNFNVFLMRNNRVVDSIFINKLPYLDKQNSMLEFVELVNKDVKDGSGNKWFKSLSKSTSLPLILKSTSNLFNVNYHGNYIYSLGSMSYKLKDNLMIRTPRNRKMAIINNLIILSIIKPSYRLDLNSFEFSKEE